MKTTFLAFAIAAALATPVAADRADDDLAAVKKAVGGAGSQRAYASARPAPEAEPRAQRPAVEDDEQSPPRRPAVRRSGDLRWFRVRVMEKAGKRARVNINLPLGLVRAIGEDWPISGCHRCEHGRGPTLGEVLRSLDAGQSLVEIDDDEATVRVWVD